MTIKGKESKKKGGVVVDTDFQEKVIKAGLPEYTPTYSEIMKSIELSVERENFLLQSVIESYRVWVK